MQRAVVITAVGIINHGLSLINETYKQVNEGNYLFTARQWLNLENSYNNKVKFDWGILSHAMTSWVIFCLCPLQCPTKLSIIFLL